LLAFLDQYGYAIACARGAFPALSDGTNNMNTEFPQRAHPHALPALILFTAVALLAVPSIFAQTVSGLIANYPLNGNANDTSGNGLNGTVLGATATTDRFGNPNSAFQFASGESIGFSSLPPLGGAHTAFTVSLWFQADGLGPIFTDYVGTQSGGDNIFAVALAIDNNPVNSSSPNYLSAGSRNYPSHSLDYTLYSGGSPIIGTGWHGLAYEMDGISSCLVFLDGTQVATLPYDATLNYSESPSWEAGHLFFAGQDQYFNGKIDDIQIYNRALSQSEIQQIQAPEPTASALISLAALGAFSIRRRGTNRNQN
jgi:hypothetical protein